MFAALRALPTASGLLSRSFVTTSETETRLCKEVLCWFEKLYGQDIQARSQVPGSRPISFQTREVLSKLNPCPSKKLTPELFEQLFPSIKADEVFSAEDLKILTEARRTLHSREICQLIYGLALAKEIGPERFDKTFPDGYPIHHSLTFATHPMRPLLTSCEAVDLLEPGHLMDGKHQTALCTASTTEEAEFQIFGDQRAAKQTAFQSSEVYAWREMRVRALTVENPDNLSRTMDGWVKFI